MMKLKKIAVSVLLATMVLTSGVPVMATQNSKVATQGERAKQSEVEEKGMYPIEASDIVEGKYDLKVESSSSMFRVVKAVLTVKPDSMTAVITLGGKGYEKLYMGTGEEAVTKDEGEYSKAIEDSNGALTYEVKVDALDKGLECTGFSKRKQKWYDHQILFRADSLPAGALKSSASKAHHKMDVKPIKLEDGKYEIKVSLKGGSGRAKIKTPAEIVVKNKKATAKITWSSKNYDYMIVNGKKYTPVNKKGNSVFEIPVLALDKKMPVIGDTTAMSKPYEIEYFLTFDKKSAKLVKVESNKATTVTIITGACVVVLVGILMWKKNKKNKHEKIKHEKK
ncbi:hypothetical protein [Lachnobacterium bovis]|uniref:Iron Transport-associated domain-containing protein n=1 Tax=Lachnobacterium bovis TaxID=140626 RepID=A0A1H9SD08_9FIRM|nr:hypothetical protein [Lachnobacterium bovis]SER82253.1 hypothetical protein SAMN02910429_01180 [Lachnobacterium bovis]